MQGEYKETTATQSQSGRPHKVCKSRLNNSSTPNLLLHYHQHTNSVLGASGMVSVAEQLI